MILVRFLDLKFLHERAAIMIGTSNPPGWPSREMSMVEVLERDTVGETIDATVNYIVNNGQKLFTETAGPGGSDVRTGGPVDPRRVPIHNARLHNDPFVLDREGFRFVRHDTA